MRDPIKFITDYIKTGNNNGLKMFLGWNMLMYVFYDFIYF